MPSRETTSKKKGKNERKTKEGRREAKREEGRNCVLGGQVCVRRTYILKAIKDHVCVFVCLCVYARERVLSRAQT